MQRVRTFLMLVAMLAVTLSCVAEVNGREVAYVGGTGSIALNTLGSLDTQRADALVFRGPVSSADIVIPYAAMTSINYRRQLTRHLGVVAGISVSLVRKRERQHFFDIAYTDAQGVKQTASFEVSKTQPQILAAVLRARAPQACGSGCKADDPGIFG